MFLWSLNFTTCPIFYTLFLPLIADISLSFKPFGFKAQNKVIFIGVSFVHLFELQGYFQNKVLRINLFFLSIFIFLHCSSELLQADQNAWTQFEPEEIDCLILPYAHECLLMYKMLSAEDNS